MGFEMQNTRRRTFVLMAAGIAAAPRPSSVWAGQDPDMEESDDPFSLPRIKESHPRAKLLGYVRDARAIDASAQPKYVPGQACSSCVFFGGKGAAWGGCALLPGAVAATGWCTQWSAKTNHSIAADSQK